MLKTCYRGLKSSDGICKYALIVHLLVYVFVKRNVHKKGHGCCTFFLQSQGGTGLHPLALSYRLTKSYFND